MVDVKLSLRWWVVISLNVKVIMTIIMIIIGIDNDVVDVTVWIVVEDESQ